MSKNIVPVFMAVDDGYIPFLGVALKSVIENSSKENKYEIKILYTKVSEENKNKIKAYETENYIHVTIFQIQHILDCLYQSFIRNMIKQFT